MIVKQGDKYIVKSEEGKNLSKPMSKPEAEHRLREVEIFKAMDKAKKGK